MQEATTIKDALNTFRTTMQQAKIWGPRHEELYKDATNAVKMLAGPAAPASQNEAPAANHDEQLRATLATVLDHVDYTKGACTVTEQVGAVLPVEIIGLAQQVLEKTAPAAAPTAT